VEGLPSPSAPPLLTEAIPGFRAWGLDTDGRLWPAAAGRSPWDAGVNVARCAHGHDHTAPAARCTCGLYAFHTVHRQLAREQVVGGIAAWGDVEVHHDGFRAGRARIVALSGRPGLRPADRRLLGLAAGRHGVPVVRLEALAPVTALACGVLPLQLVPGGGEVWLAARRGYDADQQLWVEPGGGVVHVGVSDALRTWVGGEPVASVAMDGEAVMMELAGEHATVRLATGVRGTAQPAGAGIRIVPTHWAHDCLHFDWGRTGRAAMLGSAERTGSAGFEHLVGRGALDQHAVASWADVLREMRRAATPAPPTYADARALYDDLGITLGRALAADPAHLGRLDLVLTVSVHEPDARLTFDLRGGATLRLGPGGPPGDIELALAGRDLGQLLGGRLDVARETQTGRLRLSGTRAAGLTAVAMLTAWSRRNRISPKEAVAHAR
jgi:hypothetical protein